MVTVVLRTENEAWDLLRRLLSGKEDGRSISEIEFGRWAQFEMGVSGERYRASITPRLMRGLLKFHRSFQRSFALIAHRKTDLRTLTDEEWEELELRYEIAEGSSLIKVDLGEGVKHLVDKLPKLSPGLVALVTIVLALTYCTKEAIQGYYAEATERERTAQSKQETERMRMLHEAHMRVQEQMGINAKQLRDLPKTAYHDLIVSILDADEASVSGIRFSADDIENLADLQREPYTGPREFQGPFVVHALANTNPDEYFLTVSNSEVRIRAAFNPKTVAPKILQAINRALNEKGRIYLEVRITNRYKPVRQLRGRVLRFDMVPSS